MTARLASHYRHDGESEIARATALTIRAGETRSVDRRRRGSSERHRALSAQCIRIAAHRARIQINDLAAHSLAARSLISEQFSPWALHSSPASRPPGGFAADAPGHQGNPSYGARHSRKRGPHG